jgi:hypothetical protein
VVAFKEMENDSFMAFSDLAEHRRALPEGVFKR